jgi:cold shock CspA family protein
MATEQQQATTSGRVKWFNNKAGYGFISISDCETNEERDMFVHHSEIKVEQTQYKYLVQGEYVEFVIGAINRENKTDVHATNVRGINGGKLMCETRNEVRSYRATTQGSAQQASTSRPQGSAQQASTSRPQGSAQQASTSRPQGSAQQARASSESRRPQLDKADQTEWMIVPRRRAETVPSKQKHQPRQRQPGIEIAQ